MIPQQRRRRDFLSHTAAERVARVLAELVGSYGREERGGWTLGIPLTKVELASIAGMKPRTAEKAFSDLRKAGVVVSHYRRDLLVPDLGRLWAFAGLGGQPRWAESRRSAASVRPVSVSRPAGART
ncbi:helix-turn-helix domain-containing protein [Actinosynnema sp. NPDC047251]|uniref:HTH crp-type domain-containing protein n=1 Tax=Saccharothrix espanaensis (strain ATCC 51144 / DSM 44229 / JCM 9112 / NBRC 15066 / NRRL 15764) TaxID=1179773 RepID=K0KDG3_SACES|nr:helix-turn-helix domain-containing protein [Saccharothrix espanaensis]CCH34834.1 hypothetical protein BN6_76100 [Saccharothrix espanaensis DSM 44229]